MNKRYTIFLFGIILFTIGLYNHEQQTNVTSQIACDLQYQQCVACPNINLRLEFNIQQYSCISYPRQFKVLLTKQTNYFRRIYCRQYLKFITENDSSTKLQELVKYSNQKVEIRDSLAVETMQIYNHYLNIINYSDFIIFYKNHQYRIPSITVQNHANHQRLLKFQRSIQWSLLFTIIFKFLDRGIGLFSVKISTLFPWIETIILMFGITFLSKIETFLSYYYIYEMMLLFYIVHKLIPKVNEKFIVCMFLLGCLRKQLCVIAYLFLLCAAWRYKINLNSAVSIIILISVIIGFILYFDYTNFTIYTNYLWKAIIYPLIFLQFQIPQSNLSGVKNQQSI